MCDTLPSSGACCDVLTQRWQKRLKRGGWSLHGLHKLKKHERELEPQIEESAVITLQGRRGLDEWKHVRKCYTFCKALIFTKGSRGQGIRESKGRKG